MSISKSTALVTVLVLFIIELAIFLAAASQSGIKYYTIVEDDKGRILYEAPGRGLSYYEEMSLRDTLGPIENYHVRVISQRVDFPFSAWLSASIGVPIGLMLVYALIMRLYKAVIESEPVSFKLNELDPSRKGWRRIVSLFHSLSIFHIGFIVFLSALCFWLIPHITMRALTGTLQFIKNNMLIFVSFMIFLLILAGWVVYLMYRLARDVLRYRYEIIKLQLEKAPDQEYSKLVPGLAIKQLEDKKDQSHEVV